MDKLEYISAGVDQEFIKWRGGSRVCVTSAGSEGDVPPSALKLFKKQHSLGILHDKNIIS